MIKEILSEAWPVIEKVAPVVAQALAGPLAGSAITALGLLAKKFDANDIVKLISNINSDPDAEAKLQEIDVDFSNEMTRAAVKSVGQLQNLKANIELNWKD